MKTLNVQVLAFAVALVCQGCGKIDYVHPDVNAGSAATISSHASDTTPPSVVLSAPSNNQNVAPGATLTLTATASDNVGVTRVEIYMDGALRCALTSAPYTCAIVVTATNGTSTQVQAKAYDAAGNVAASSISTIVVSLLDTTAPTVTLNTPSGAEALTAGTNVPLTAAASDNVAVTKVEMYVNGALKCTMTITPYTCNFATAGLAGNSYSVQAKAYDAAGNIGVSPVNTLTILQPEPAEAVNVWSNLAIPDQMGSFTARFTASVSAANSDTCIGFSNGSASAYTALATTVRFNSSGVLDVVHDGTVYSADTAITYTPGTDYAFRMVVDTTAHTYSVYVSQGGGAEQVLASNYAFRSDQVAVIDLNNRAVISTVGVASISGFSITP